jgi:hypothetical protein
MTVAVPLLGVDMAGATSNGRDDWAEFADGTAGLSERFAGLQDEPFVCDVVDSERSLWALGGRDMRGGVPLCVSSGLERLRECLFD